MAKHKTGTWEEWLAARHELLNAQKGARRSSAATAGPAPLQFVFSRKVETDLF
jgi:hypothetical protein